MKKENHNRAQIIQGRFNQQNHPLPYEGQLAQIIDINPLLKKQEDERRREQYAEISKLADHLNPLFI